MALGRRPISRDPRPLSILPLEANRRDDAPQRIAYKLIEEARLAKQAEKQTANGKVR